MMTPIRDEKTHAEDAAAAWWAGKPFPDASWGRPYLCDRCSRPITTREGTSLVEGTLLCPTCTAQSFPEGATGQQPESTPVPTVSGQVGYSGASPFATPPPPAHLAAPTPPAPPQRAPVSPAARRRRRRLVIAGIALAAVIGLIVGLFVWAPWVKLPKTPTNLAETSATASTITITWQPGHGGSKVTRYLIYRAGTNVATVPGSQTSYIDKNLRPGVTYTYAVKAKTGSHYSAVSTEKRITTATPSPVGLTAGTATGTSLSFSWSRPPQSPVPDTYTVLRAGTTISTVPGTTTTYKDSGVTPGAAYRYQVSAEWGGHSSQPSAALTMKTVFFDGSWSGSTSQGLPIKFKVADAEITWFSVTTRYGGASCPLVESQSYGSVPPGAIPVENDHFVIGGDVPGGILLSGTFSSGVAASGTVRDTPPAGHQAAGCTPVAAQWTARKG
jgi:hypothetical protein